VSDAIVMPSAKPKGVYGLFFIQIFSTFSFSVLNFTLVLYMTLFLHLSDKLATSIIASFTAFNFALHLIGGYLGGRFLTYRSLFCLSMILQAIGCFVVSSLNLTCLYWGLALFLTGAGLNVTCVNCMLTQLFEPEDKRSEGAFMLNYSGMNIGFFLGITLSGILQSKNLYHSLFFISSFTNIIAIILTIWNWKQLGDKETHLTSYDSKKRQRNNFFGICLIAAMIPSLYWMLNHALFSNNLVILVGFVMMFVIIALALRQPTKELSNKVWAYLILGIASLVFFILYQLAPMGLMLFIERNVNRSFGNQVIPAEWFQNINTVLIVLGGPALAWAFSKVREKGFNLTIPVQFATALLLIGLAFIILPIGIRFGSPNGLVGSSWIVASFVLQTIGELFISPIGYSMIGYLAPPKLQGMMMGTWLMITGVAASLAGHFSKLAVENSTSILPLDTNPGYSHVFNLLGWSAFGFGILMFIFVPFVNKLMKQQTANS
jgi:POT family proton-dependent oligopeptide transporter